MSLAPLCRYPNNTHPNPSKITLVYVCRFISKQEAGDMSHRRKPGESANDKGCFVCQFRFPPDLKMTKRPCLISNSRPLSRSLFRRSCCHPSHSCHPRSAARERSLVPKAAMNSATTRTWPWGSLSVALVNPGPSSGRLTATPGQCMLPSPLARLLCSTLSRPLSPRAAVSGCCGTPGAPWAPRSSL